MPAVRNTEPALRVFERSRPAAGDPKRPQRSGISRCRNGRLGGNDLQSRNHYSRMDLRELANPPVNPLEKGPKNWPPPYG